MQVYYELPFLTTPTAVTVGKFFAVHLGHQSLLRATAEAAGAGRLSLVLTFDRHPSEILTPGRSMPELTSLPERLQLIEQTGVEAVVVMPLTREFLSISPEEFLAEILARRLCCSLVVSAPGFRYGRAAAGDVDLIRSRGAEWGIDHLMVEPVLVDGRRISSSRVADAIAAGEVDAARGLLGRSYNVPGLVVQGDGAGRQLGFPTANVRYPGERLLPADGVYTVTLEVEGHEIPGVANLGRRPTRDGFNHLLEVHALDWSGDLYGAEVDVRFIRRLRDERKFGSLAELSEQIARDAEAARTYFASPEGSLRARI